MVKVQNVSGIRVRKPPILKMSCSWWQPWMTEPEPRNMRALKKACVVRWNIAAPTPAAITTVCGSVPCRCVLESEPRPKAATINPSWESVE